MVPSRSMKTPMFRGMMWEQRIEDRRLRVANCKTEDAGSIFDPLSSIFDPPVLVNHRERLLGDFVRSDARHAAMINRAFSQKAWTAFNPFVQHYGRWTHGSGGDLIGRSENRERRNTQRCSEMHRSGIIGQE